MGPDTLNFMRQDQITQDSETFLREAQAGELIVVFLVEYA